MKHLRRLIGVVAAIVLIAFAIANTQTITLSFYPLPFQVAVPLYLVILGALVVGVFIGGVSSWLAARRHRRIARQRRRRIEALEAELAQLKQQAETKGEVALRQSA